ncbi:hypothetical protein CCMA1212_000237 [Trichoderma ghanense]|uniref:SSCRP protein n=1 Tax=Trichoderma ghanense TaxID=65468 RepID=A0ABY2HJ11_9HYPO
MTDSLAAKLLVPVPVRVLVRARSFVYKQSCEWTSAVLRDGPLGGYCKSAAANRHGATDRGRTSSPASSHGTWGGKPALDLGGSAAEPDLLAGWRFLSKCKKRCTYLTNQLRMVGVACGECNKAEKAIVQTSRAAVPILGRAEGLRLDARRDDEVMKRPD